MHPFEAVAITLFSIMFLVVAYYVGLANGLDSINSDCIKFGKFYVVDNEFICTLVKEQSND